MKKYFSERTTKNDKKILKLQLSLIILFCALIFSCDVKISTFVGESADALDRITDGHSTEYIFFDADPYLTENSIKKSFKIGSVITPSDFPTFSKDGYRIRAWGFFDNSYPPTGTPSNIVTNEDGYVLSVQVGLRQLNFYIKEWDENIDTKYVINHHTQNTDLETYFLYYTIEKYCIQNYTVKIEDEYIIIDGFGYSFFQGDLTIREDSSSVIDIFYNRASVAITIISEMGTFVSDPNIESMEIVGTYGCQIQTEQLPVLKKDGYEIQYYRNESTGELTETLDIFPSKETSYTVIWYKS